MLLNHIVKHFSNNVVAKVESKTLTEDYSLEQDDRLGSVIALTL
jgi:hypothetical protein